MVSAGVIPTPAVAYLTRTEGFDAGIVISASHNPYEDNGIKIFSGRGEKLTSSSKPRSSGWWPTVVVGAVPDAPATASSGRDLSSALRRSTCEQILPTPDRSPERAS